MAGYNANLPDPNLPAGVLVPPPYFMGVYVGKKMEIVNLGYKVIVLNPGDVLVLGMTDYAATVQWNGNGDVSKTFAIIEKDMATSPFMALNKKEDSGKRLAKFAKCRVIASEVIAKKYPKAEAKIPIPKQDESGEEPEILDKKKRK